MDHPTRPRPHPAAFTFDRLMLALDDRCGLCTGCGAEARDVEPTARRLVCARCHDATLHGAEELMLQAWALAPIPGLAA